MKLVTYTAGNNRRILRRFSKGKVNCLSNIYYEKNNGEMLGEKNIDIPHLFIDFQAAYGTVRRKELWSEMRKLCFPQKLVTWSRILRNNIV